MYETVELWIMGKFWRNMDVMWPRDPHVEGYGQYIHRYVSVLDGPAKEHTCYFIFEHFAPHCYVLVDISDRPHWEGGYKSDLPT